MSPVSAALPALSVSVPPVTFTWPLLLNAVIERLLAAPPLLVSTPALLKVPLLLNGLPSVEERFHCPWLFTTALAPSVTRLPPVWFTVPTLFHVRVSRFTNPVTLVVPLVVSTPGPPSIVPADQVNGPVVMPSLPVSVPAESVSVLAKLTVGPVVLKLAVPPLIVVVPVPAML